MGSAASCGNPSRSARILMVGLDEAGKTTILYRLRLGETVSTIPTVGFNVETLEQSTMQVTLWDVGGQEKIRPLWRHYTEGTQGVFYVVDSTDRERLEDSRSALHKLLLDGNFNHTPFIILANKQDKEGAMSNDEIERGLQLDSLGTNEWLIQKTCAVTGEGLKDAMLTICKLVSKRK